MTPTPHDDDRRRLWIDLDPRFAMIDTGAEEVSAGDHSSLSRLGMVDLEEGKREIRLSKKRGYGLTVEFRRFLTVRQCNWERVTHLPSLS